MTKLLLDFFARRVVQRVKIPAAYFIRQKFFVILVYVTKNRAAVINFAKLSFFVEIFADSVAAI